MFSKKKGEKEDEKKSVFNLFNGSDFFGGVSYRMQTSNRYDVKG
jgi:hypothetical protein